jgi:hypothetical protein
MEVVEVTGLLPAAPRIYCHMPTFVISSKGLVLGLWQLSRRNDRRRPILIL